MNVSINSSVKNFPFVYVWDGKKEYDDYVCLYHNQLLK